MTVHAIRLGLVLLLGIVWFSLNAQQVSACLCPFFTTTAEWLEYSDAVFKGRVTAIHYSDVPHDQRKTWADIVVAFEVNSVWKGPLYHKMYVLTNRHPVSCGFEFDYGNEYLVYVKDGEAGWCGTLQIRDAQGHLTALGLSSLPTFGTSQQFPHIPGVVNPLWTATPTPTPQPTVTPTPVPTATFTPYPTTTPTPEPQQDVSSNASGCNLPSQLSSSGTDATWLGVMAALVWFGVRRRKP